MRPELIQIVGGLGLFLVGMVTVSQGLRDLAGAAIRRGLRRFTRSPATGALTGAVATCLVRSSSITTVTAVGFAGAGLLTFPEALGIVFGANIGTTVTGWIVALVGFKLQVATAMPFVVLLGALLRIFGRGRAVSIGLAVAGFGLAFMGIEMLRVGASGFSDVVTPQRFPDATLVGRLQLVGLGVGFTLITQSSSAGVAIALAAIAGGAIEFEQAAALVIGMDVGTTFTAAVATVGASLPGRRTGWAHVIYNVLTAIGALFLLPLYQLVANAAAPGFLVRQPEFALVGFHSLFNTLGVLAILPFTGPFAHLVERLVPDRPSPFTARLDRRLLSQPDVALRALAPTLTELADHAVAILRAQLEGRGSERERDRNRGLLEIAMDDVERYVTLIVPTRESINRRNAAIRAVDLLNRLLAREAQAERVDAIRRDPRLERWASRLSAALGPESESFASDDGREADLAALCRHLERERYAYREAIGSDVGPGALEAADALRLMDAFRWLERTTHHCWRIVHHLAQLRSDAPASRTSEPPEPD